MLAAVSSVLTIFLIIGAGWVLARRGILSDEAGRLFTWLVINMTLPAMMIAQLCSSFTRSDLLGAGRGLAVPAAATLATFMAGRMVACAAVAPGRRGAFTAMFATTNAIFVGMPVNLAIFGPAAIPGVLYFYTINATVFWTLGAHGIESDAGRHVPMLSREHLSRILLSPPFLGLAVGSTLVLVGVRIPDFLMSAMKHLGAMTTPLSLLFMGITFASVEVAELRPTRDMGLLFLGRFLVAPGLVYMFCRLWPVPPLMAKVFMVQASMPAVTQAALLARQVEADHRYTTVLVSATNLASLAGLPLFLALFTVLFPG